jgi:Exostosin family
MIDTSLATPDAAADDLVRSQRDAPIWVFTPYYKASTRERQAEIDLCVEKNLACDAIDRIVLLVDDGHAPPFDGPRLSVRAVSQRPTYRLWLECSSELGLRGISVLANSDIYFDETLPQLRRYLDGPQKFMALSRHDKVGTSLVPHPNPKWSQDVWAVDMRSHLAPGLVKSLDIPLGVPRCDNKVAYLFAVHGWDVFNPMSHVRSVHVHETQQRNYDKRADLTVIGAVAYVRPTSQHGVPSDVEIDVWARRTKAIAGVSLNRSLDLWTQGEARPGVASPTPEPPRSPVAQALQPAVGPKRGPAAPTQFAQRALPAIETIRVEGSLVFSDSLRRFTVLRHAGHCYGLDRLRPAQSLLLPDRADDPTPEDILGTFITPVLNTDPIVVGDRPGSERDSHFWQYPAATERQARDNHLKIERWTNVDVRSKLVHTYLALPWATYIDRKDLPAEVIALIAPRVRGLARLARELGYALRVHTVCQQIHWRRMLETFGAVGVTDLHLSHDVHSLHAGAESPSIRIHSWPLIAPNIEVAERRAGLEIGKPVRSKRYLASFVGAHMPHYRSDVRVRLLEAARLSGRTDVIVSLGDEWHFNRVVYQEQVNRKRLDPALREAEGEAVRRYNELLCDSVFSLCPEGAGPNTLRVWESLAVGAIPVIFAPEWRAPVASPGGLDAWNCTLFVDGPPDASLFERLAAFPPAELERMQRACTSLYEQMRKRKTFE